MIKSFSFLVVAMSASLAWADPLTRERVDEMPAEEREPWLAYLEQSRKLALADEAAVQAEVAANKMTSALRAPDGGDFKLPAPAGDPWYAGDEARQLAEAVLSYQTPSGGWSKHIGFSRGPRKPGMQWTSQNEPGRPAHYVATFDNRSTTEQLHFLAHMWRATRGETYKAAFLKGLNFILAAQYPCGGWPQVFPLEGGYHDNITLNDDATVHIFEVLSAVARGEPGYDFVNEPQRQQAAAALAAGIDCVLKMQVQQNGTRTVWCGQHDPLTLRPAAARIMEPATLSGLESARMLKFLMTIADPEPQVAVCIEAGLTWLEAARITNVRKATENGKTVYVVDSKSDEVYWARFYDLASSRPVFPGRDGELYESFAAMAAKNDLGYDYYTTLPGSIVTNGQKKWRKMLAESGGKPKQ